MMKITKNKYFVAGLISTALLIADQATKFLALRHLMDGPITVTPFFNFVLVWNRGISFGMFGGDQALSPLVLVGSATVIVAGLVYWLVTTTHRPVVWALAAVIAGAIGNMIDRLRLGAVVDFLDFHIAGYHWPAFNVADCAVVLGIAFIIVDSLFFESKRAKAQDATPDEGPKAA